MRLRILLTALAIALPCAAMAAAPPRVFSDTGNIFVERDGAKTQLTRTEQDVEPVLSPNGKVVVFTRQGRGHTPTDDIDQTCETAPRPDELRQINIDGTNDTLLLRGRKGDPQQQLCAFRNKQFSSNGERLYFLSPGWATSGALHVYDMRTHDEHFVLPANDLLVLNFCRDKYKDDLVVQSHRYFLFGGSYDWYWLYDPTGKKELGPLGEFDNPDEVIKQAHESWCAP